MCVSSKLKMTDRSKTSTCRDSRLTVFPIDIYLSERPREHGGGRFAEEAGNAEQHDGPGGAGRTGTETNIVQYRPL